MGNEESTPISDNTPPSTLSARTISAVAAYLTSSRVSSVVVMTGAGISTSAGIPDFRSPETGLYANLARLNLPYAEAVFDISFFRSHPEPFYTLAHELYPGKFRPTLAHAFIRLLHDKHKLKMLFTQNIDCLERAAGVPDGKIVEAHGSFARQSCIECREAFPAEEMRSHVADQKIPRCKTCGGLVKPEIVFFGEALPKEFHDNKNVPGEADLCLVMGTSLTVQPFASLPVMARQSTPRVLINKEVVGGLGTRADDVLILGDCDDGVKRLAEACGWWEDLETLWAGMVGPSSSSSSSTREDIPAAMASPPEKQSKDEALQDEVDRLTAEIDQTLAISKQHEQDLRAERTHSTNTEKHWSNDDVESNLSHVFVSRTLSPDSQMTTKDVANPSKPLIDNVSTESKNKAPKL